MRSTSMLLINAREFLTGICLLSILLFPIPTFSALEHEDIVLSIIRSLEEQLRKIHENTSSDTASSLNKLRSALEDKVDFRYIGIQVLGTKRDRLSSDQFELFQKELRKYIISTIYTYFNKISGESFYFDNLVPWGQYKNFSEVCGDLIIIGRRTEMRRNRLCWRMLIGSQGPKIVDIFVDGSSAVANWQTDLGEILESKGFDPLISELRIRSKL